MSVIKDQTLDLGGNKTSVAHYPYSSVVISFKNFIIYHHCTCVPAFVCVCTCVYIHSISVKIRGQLGLAFMWLLRT